jgi:hypothetical protein
MTLITRGAVQFVKKHTFQNLYMPSKIQLSGQTLSRINMSKNIIKRQTHKEVPQMSLEELFKNLEKQVWVDENGRFNVKCPLCGRLSNRKPYSIGLIVCSIYAIKLHLVKHHKFERSAVNDAANQFWQELLKQKTRKKLSQEELDEYDKISRRNMVYFYRDELFQIKSGKKLQLNSQEAKVLKRLGLIEVTHRRNKRKMNGAVLTPLCKNILAKIQKET